LIFVENAGKDAASAESAGNLFKTYSFENKMLG